MSFIAVGLAAFFASLLTFFSGFGLGTVLLPVFAVWFPIEVAVALTAIVHLLNNLFKFLLIGKFASKAVILRFGIPAVLAAVAGAALLVRLADLEPIFSYRAFGAEHEVTPLKLVIAVIMAVFTLIEVLPKWRHIQFSEKHLPIGGILSGFFGGLSGHQGALRSAFLVRSDLSKEAFIATGVVIACFVDLARLAIYARNFFDHELLQNWPILTTTTLAAFAGALIGSQLLKKITMAVVQKVVAIGLLLLSIGIGSGLI